MSLLAIVLRVLFGYVVLLTLTRLSGKRTLRQTTPLDLTASVIASDLIDDLLWGEVPAAQFVVAIGTLVTLAVAVSAGSARHRLVERCVLGAPVEVIRSGEILARGCARERLSRSELMMMLREQNIDDVREVERAALETDGRLGICRREWAQEAQKQDTVRVRQAAGGGS